jgi:hypothetical protein
MLMMHDAELIKVEWDENGNPIRVSNSAELFQAHPA